MMPYCHGRHTIRPILRSRELRMRYQTKRRKRQKNSTLPPRGNTIQNRQFRLWKCYQNFTSSQAETLYLFQFTVPFAEMHIKIFIPPSWEYDLELTVPLAGMQSKYCIPASGYSETISFVIGYFIGIYSWSSGLVSRLWCSRSLDQYSTGPL